MPSTLGLVGDLDDVELIQDVEEAFGVWFSDDELNRCYTVGDLFRLVETQLPPGAAGGCATAICFYRLRRGLQPRIATKLQPKTAISGLGCMSVRNLHRIIEQECHLRPPMPYISVWGCIALLLAGALPLGVLALGMTWWVAAVSVIPAIVLYRMAPIRLPETIHTFGDLVRLVTSRSVGRLSQEGARLGSSEAWSAFKDILSDHSLLPKNAISPDTLIYASKKAAS